MARSAPGRVRSGLTWSFPTVILTKVRTQMAKPDLYGTGGSSLYELGPDLRQDDGEGWFHTPHFPGRRAGTDRRRHPPRLACARLAGTERDASFPLPWERVAGGRVRGKSRCQGADPPHPPLRGFTLDPAHPLRPFGWQGVYGPVCPRAREVLALDGRGGWTRSGQTEWVEGGWCRNAGAFHPIRPFGPPSPSRGRTCSVFSISYPGRNCCAGVTGPSPLMGEVAGRVAARRSG